MCVNNLIQRYNAWVNQKHMHPIWLQLKDQEMQSKYDLWLRNYFQWLVKMAFFSHLAYFVGGLILNYDKSFSEQTLFIMHLGSFTASQLVAWLISLWKLTLIDYSVIICAFVRCFETLLVLHLIEAKSPGFESIEKKDLADSIMIILQPCFILAFSSIKLNVSITAPFGIFCLCYSLQLVYSTADDNLACFIEPEG